MCQSQTLCKIGNKCSDGTTECNIFSMTFEFWRDSGMRSPYGTDNEIQKNYTNASYQECQRDPYCSTMTVQLYMINHQMVSFELKYF